jgi:hypothetical protein
MVWQFTSLNIIFKERCNMKKKLALMLATVTAVATIFTGCGGKDISGNYVSEIKLAQFSSQEDMQALADVGINAGDITMDVTLELSDDNTFTMAFDTTSFKDQFSTLVDDNMDTIIDKSLESEGYSRSDITDEVAQYAGYESADALFADLENEIKGSLDDIYSGIDEELQEYSVSGDYKVKKDSVVFVVNGEDELLLDKGTLNEDGSITVNSESDGTVVSLEFELQQ